MSNNLSDVKGGISFRSPIFSFGQTIPDINSGFNFDLPLATVAQFSQQAYEFASGNAARNQGFITGVIGRSQSSLDSTRGQVVSFQNRSLSTLDQFGRRIQKISEPKGCFITTAICDMENKPDDCYELTSFRSLRDEYMLKHPEHRELVELYYDIAPDIVAGIDARNDSDIIYTRLNQKYLMPALKAIEMGDFETAVDIYKSMVRYAMRYKVK